jgi:hypothetical protein
VCRVRTAGLFHLATAREIAMLTPNPAIAGPATPQQPSSADLQQLAERLLRRNPYLAQKNISCDCRYGVLVLRGSLPSYYLKQVAQEVVGRLEWRLLTTRLRSCHCFPTKAGAQAARDPGRA